MTHRISIKSAALAMFVFALSMTALGQATDAFIGSTKSNTKNALTRTETVDPKIKDGIAVAMKGLDCCKALACCFFPPKTTSFSTSAREKYSFAQIDVSSTRQDLVKGVNVGIIYVEANSKDLPNGYYTVNIKQVGKDEKGNPQYGFTLTNGNGIQALSIGAKTNGAAGNTNGLGAKRQGMTTANSGGTVKGGQVSGTAAAKSADYEALGKSIEDAAKRVAECKECTVFMPIFKKTGSVETLSTDGLDTQIVEAVAAFVSSTKSNTKTA